MLITVDFLAYLDNSSFASKFPQNRKASWNGFQEEKFLHALLNEKRHVYNLWKGSFFRIFFGGQNFRFPLEHPFEV